MIHVGDCREVMRTLDANSFDAVVTDPPYHLRANKKDDPRRASPDKRQRDRGFMGQVWDGGDVAFRPETWAEVLRVAKPGAHLIAFGGTRTFHRLMCAIEDAGWELRDTLQWIYASGFPKSRNLCQCQPHVETALVDAHGWRLCGTCGEPYELGTALKPAWEPIVLARKPISERTVRANVARWGTGALNIEECRIEVEDVEIYARNCSGDRGHDATRTKGGATDITAGGGQAAEGRWPANVLHDGSGEVLAAFPNAPGQKAPVRGTESSAKIGNVFNPTFAGRSAVLVRGDGGQSAARFFYCAKVDRKERNEGLEGWEPQPLHWSAGDQSPGTFQRPGTRKVSENHHPTVKPIALMRWLCRLVTPRGGLVADPFTGSGSTGCAAIAEGFQFVGMEKEPAYAAIAEARTRAIQPGLPMSMTG